jgi:thiamine biosynthesis lipoprotein
VTDIAHIFKAGKERNIIYARFPAMHTRVDIVIVSERDETSLLYVINDIFHLIGVLERKGNCFDPDSELSKYNAGELKQDQLDDELRHILSLCEKWKQATNGLFDAAVEGKYNLSGFLKGYCLDRIHSLLATEGIADALINMGNSSVMALGSQSERRGWPIVNLETGKKVVLYNECLTTSGNDSQERYHIIDPITKRYVRGKRVVSVITPTGTEGEVRSIEKFIKTHNNG